MRLRTLCAGERPFQCAMCEKSFRDRSELNRHSRRHTGDLPYKCGTCGKGFLRRERFVTHTRIHTGEKPFVCGVCNRGYRDKRELKKHQATHNHGDPDSPTSPDMGSPGPPTHQVTVMPAAASTPTSSRSAAAVAASKQSPIQVAVQQQPASPSPAPVSASSSSSGQQMTTITIPLPTEPVPKAQLGIQQPPPPPEPQYLNPAQIVLPQSVQTALQNFNQKAKTSSSPVAVPVSMAQQVVKQEQQQQQMQILKPVQIVDGAEGQQLQQLPAGLVSGVSAGHPQVFYIAMPSAGGLVQPYALEGGIKVATEGGTAQLVTLPPGFQAAAVPGSSGLFY